MTKSDIYKFLDMKREEVMQFEQDVYEDSLSKHEQKVKEELQIDEYSDEIKKYIDKAEDIYKEWKHKVESNKDYEIKKYYTMNNWFLSFTFDSENIKNHMMEYEFYDNSKELMKIKKRYADNCSNINTNFINVKNNVKSISTANKAAEYLKELGFDVSQLEDEGQKCVALTSPIDTKFLFISSK